MILALAFYAVLSATCLLPLARMLSTPAGLGALLPVPVVEAPAPDATYDWIGLV